MKPGPYAPTVQPENTTMTMLQRRLHLLPAMRDIPLFAGEGRLSPYLQTRQRLYDAQRPVDRPGYGDGGMAPADVAPLPLPERPRSPVPDYLLKQQAEGVPGAKPPALGGTEVRDLIRAYQRDRMGERAKMSFPEQLSDAGSNLAGIGRNVKDVAASMLPDFDPAAETERLRKPGTIGENLTDFAAKAPGAALAVAPYAGNAERLAAGPGRSLMDALYKTAPRVAATTAATIAPDQIKQAFADDAKAQSKLAAIEPPAYMTEELKGLNAQKAAKQAEFTAMNERYKKAGPETQRQALDPLRADLAGLNDKISAAEGRVRAYMEGVTEKARQELPFRERYPGAAQAITGGAAALGTALPFANAVKDRLGNYMSSALMRRGASKAEQAFEANNPAKFTEMQRSLGRQADRIDDAGSFLHGHLLPVVKGAGMSGLLQYEASAVPEQVDALAFPPGHPTREQARAEFSNPDYYKSRILPSVTAGIATAGLGHELGTLVTPGARVPESARNIIARGSPQSIEDLRTYGNYRRAVEDARGVGPTAGDAQRLEAAASAPALEARPGTSDQLMLPAPRPTSSLAERLPAYREAAGPLGGIRSDAVENALALTRKPLVPSPVAAPSLPVPSASEPPLPFKLPKGHRHVPEGVGSQVQGPDGKFVEMAPLLKKSSSKSLPKREGNEGGTPEKKSGGIIRAALDTALKYAKGGKVTVGAVMGKTGGREDAKPVNVPAGAFVFPADYVSYRGQGNTGKGMAELTKEYGPSMKASRGGSVPILISDGEFVADPAAVARKGGGDMNRGHHLMDEEVVRGRQDHIAQLSRLPGPQRG